MSDFEIKMSNGSNISFIDYGDCEKFVGVERHDVIQLLISKLIVEEATEEDVLAICALLPSLIHLVKDLNARNKGG